MSLRAIGAFLVLLLAAGAILYFTSLTDIEPLKVNRGYSLMDRALTAVLGPASSERPYRAFHIGAYAGLSFLLLMALERIRMSRGKRLTITVVAVILFAMADEGHQYFVSMRSPQVEDLACDLLGLSWAVTGYVLWRWERGYTAP